MKTRSAREQPGESGWYAISQLAQTALRSVLREVALDDLLSRQKTLNAKVQTILDQHTDFWGIKVALVAVKQVELPQEMQRAMSKLAEADAVAAKEPVAIQLRYWQTLTEDGS